MLIHKTLDDFSTDRVEIPIGGELRNNRPDPYQVNRGITRVYYFVRNDSGDLVADVNDERDIRRLLSIREGFAPYGTEALEEARTKHRWHDFGAARPAPAVSVVDRGAPNLPDDPSQPPVRTELYDDDGRLLDEEEEGGDFDGTDGDPDGEGDGSQPGGEGSGPAPVNLGDLPAVPNVTADGAEWLAYATALPGISPLIPGLSKDKAREAQNQLAAQLRTYAMENYGAELPPNKGTLVLAKEIGKLQIAAEAG